jgi:hypothetical protein
MMDRLALGEKIAGASALLLFGFMFLDWFGLEEPLSGTPLPTIGNSAWDTLNFISIVLTVAILAALSRIALRLSNSIAEPIVPVSLIVAGLGAVSFLLIGFRILDPPEAIDIPGVAVDTTREIGVFLGLVAAAGIAVGGYLAWREEELMLDSAGDPDAGAGAGPPPPPPT